ncbi:hypothetical protein U1Q18_046350, partial [Sarracenia purpurea var. burkii]
CQCYKSKSGNSLKCQYDLCANRTSVQIGSRTALAEIENHKLSNVNGVGGGGDNHTHGSAQQQHQHSAGDSQATANASNGGGDVCNGCTGQRVVSEQRVNSKTNAGKLSSKTFPLTPAEALVPLRSTRRRANYGEDKTYRKWSRRSINFVLAFFYTRRGESTWYGFSIQTGGRLQV